MISFAAPGDRTHIPAASRPIFDVLSNEVKRLKQITPVSLMISFIIRYTKLTRLFDFTSLSKLRLLPILRNV